MGYRVTTERTGESKLLISLAGASGSGKTFSGLTIATGLDAGGGIAVIDTESRRAEHYRGRFDFTHIDMTPPFGPSNFVEAFRQAEALGVDVIVIDSMSHEHAGTGGLIEMAEASNIKGPGAWAKPKAQHKRMMNALMQARCHIVFCLRADQKLDLSNRDRNGKVIVEHLGWEPICEKSFPYEMTISLTFAPEAPGVIDYTLPHKIQDQHRAAFMPGELVSREAGAALLSWANGTDLGWEHKDLWDNARKIANEGTERFRTYWKSVATREEKAALAPILTQLKSLCEAGDRNTTPFYEDQQAEKGVTGND